MNAHELCTKHLAALQGIHPELRHLGYQLVAISPDSVGNHAKFLAEHKPDYVLLSDPEFAAVRAFGLGFRLAGETVAKYAKWGLPLSSPPGMEDKVLPVPAVYLVTPRRTIAYAHYEPDYKQRLEPQELLRVAAAQR